LMIESILVSSPKTGTAKIRAHASPNLPEGSIDRRHFSSSTNGRIPDCGIPVRSPSARSCAFFGYVEVGYVCLLQGATAPQSGAPRLSRGPVVGTLFGSRPNPRRCLRIWQPDHRRARRVLHRCADVWDCPRKTSLSPRHHAQTELMRRSRAPNDAIWCCRI